jgi:hypothetical protein
MSYELTSRTIALNPEAVATLFPALLAQYGEAAPRRRGEHHNHRRSLG